MFGEEKNLKDPKKDFIKDTSSIPAPYLPSWRGGSGSYSKTNKLITALFMVTDIIDKDEPLRNRLRTLGTEVISDIHSIPVKVCGKIAEIMSFLEIASAVSIISEMNHNILKKEFLELSNSINESTKVKTYNGQINLTGFFTEELSPPVALNEQSHKQGQSKEHYQSIGHIHSTRIGVQKGSTLLKALSNINLKTGDSANFDILKKQRRDEIIGFITKNKNGVTITDIKNGTQGVLASCGEKTLQRELISMVKDGVLNKTGEKRWSRYFLKTP